MTQVIIQPAGSDAAQEHYAATIASRVPFARLLPLLAPEQRSLLTRSLKGPDAPIWGVTRGGSGRNKQLFDKVMPRDIILFARRRKVIASAPVLLTLVNREVALELWGADKNGETWENLMLLGDVEEHDISYADFNAAVGYQEDALLQNFRVLSPEKSALALSLVRGESATQRSKAYLLTWNPERFDWKDRDTVAAKVNAGEQVRLQWSSGNTKSLPIGSRVFLLQQGEKGRGLIASGWSTAEPQEGPHWDEERRRAGDLAWFVEIELDALQSSSVAPVDPRNDSDGSLAVLDWTPAASGQSVEGATADALESLWSSRLDVEDHPVSPMDPELSAMEGQLRRRFVMHRRRERALRAAKIAAARSADPEGRLRCEVPRCGFDFNERYGADGDGYAQVHHLRQLAEADKPVRTTLQDLAVVCANCHAIIHRGGANRPLESLIKY